MNLALDKHFHAQSNGNRFIIYYDDISKIGLELQEKTDYPPTPNREEVLKYLESWMKGRQT